MRARPCTFALTSIAEILQVQCALYLLAPPGAVDGDGMALAGLLLGWVHLALIIVVVMFIFLFLGGLAFFAHLGH